MATNYLHPGDVVERTAPSGGVTAGTPVVIGGEFLVPLTTAAINVQFSAQVTGVFTLAKTSAQAWTNGQKVYWDAGNARADSDATKGIFIGTADAAAANPSATAPVRLAGPQAFLEGTQAAITDLGQDISATYVEAEVQAISDKVDEILAMLRIVGLITP